MAWTLVANLILAIPSATIVGLELLTGSVTWRTPFFAFLAVISGYNVVKAVSRPANSPARP